ncbi:signal peptide peptidase SppA [archaeon]|nr:signal peptide peptidase SppA [archaeon]
MNWFKILSVFIVLLGFALSLGFLLGVVFQVPYGNIAVVKVYGEITTGSQLLSNAVDAQAVVDQLREVNANPLIEAVIIDINSGGGSSVASSEIVDAVKKLNKPSVALIREVGASGAYWVASAADYIIAHNLSLIGSLGVNMQYLEYSGLLERFNVSYVNLTYPRHKDILSQYRPLTELERDWVNEWLEEAYNYLVSDVASNLNLTKEELMPYANGSVFLGSQSVSYGLIDETGGWDKALNKTMELANITEPMTITYREEHNLLELINGLTGGKDISIKT